VDLAASAPRTARGPSHDPAVAVTGEDPEVFLFAQPNGGHGGGGEFLLEQGKIVRIRFVLDGEVIRAAH
jgi:hypothetical protein